MSRKVTYVELIEDNDCWQLTFKDGLVQLIRIDFRLGLFLSDGNKLWHLYIEQPCHLISKKSIFEFGIERLIKFSARYTSVNANVTQAIIHKTGYLKG
jgi:hypothetical protein